MIRRDYILRMIEEFARALARIRALKNEERLDEASALTEEEFRRVSGLDSQALLRLSETELMARLIETEPAGAVREKVFFVTTLLKECGDAAATEDRIEDARTCYLKGLHLLLDSLARGNEFEQPEFVPKVELFVSALADGELPIQTQALLMQHYERTGQFGKAEDALFGILAADPTSLPALDFATAFYERLQGLDDLRLEEGNLPRAEVIAGVEEIRAKRAASA
jgi:tetratricopeptide (TPR) repeat protein